MHHLNLNTTMRNHNGLNDEEVKLTAELLSRLTPGYQPEPIFLQLARIVTLPTVELIAFSEDRPEPQVTLTQRDTHDIFGEELWHIPGKVVLSTDESLEATIERLLENELGGLETTAPHHLKTYLRNTVRGKELVSVHTAIAVGTPVVGELFSVSGLPGNIYHEHPGLIREAYEFSQELF